MNNRREVPCLWYCKNISYLQIYLQFYHRFSAISIKISKADNQKCKKGQIMPKEE